MKTSKTAKIYVAGHNGMVGSACLKALDEAGYSNLIVIGSKTLDLRNQSLVENFISKHKPDVIINAAARVGGILANNDYPYNFLIENILIQSNLIASAHQNDVKKFIFLGSSCIYPKFAPQPLKEEYLLTDKLEPTNQWYAIAKIAGLKLCEAYRQQYGCNYITAMPTNLYGPNDNFHPEHSHVPAALLRRFHEAKLRGDGEVEVWGTGKPRREFLHVDDLASACVYLLQYYSGKDAVNIGTGNDISIAEFAKIISQITHYEGNIVYNTEKPDGTMIKRLDVSKINSLGWKYNIELISGLGSTYEWAVSNQVI